MVVDSYSEDYKHWENAQVMTLRTPRRANGEQTDALYWDDSGTTRGAVAQGDLTRARSAFGVANVTGDDRLFIVPASLVINATKVTTGDVLQAAKIEDIDSETESWRINNVQEVQLGTQYMCLCAKA